MKELTETQKAYIAGILDGEGHLGVAQDKNSYLAKCYISNTNEYLIDWLIKTIGFGSKIDISSDYISNKSRSFRWLVQDGKQIRSLLTNIKDYLVIKEYQAELILRFNHNKSGFRLSEEEREFRMTIYNQITPLNRRGTDNLQDHLDLQIWNVGYFISKLSSLKETEKAYLAAALDGEGHVSSFYDGYYYIRCGICNTNADFVKYLKELTGVGQISLKKPECLAYKTKSDWQLRKNEIASFLRIIQPYLIIKKEHANLGIQALSIRKAYRHCPATQAELLLRKEIHEKLCFLNRRGYNANS